MTDYFYFRCSTDLQDATRQKESALKNGILEENIYGDYSKNKDYIEAHHLEPKSEILKKLELGEELSRNEKDFAILCANCHRMVHKKNPPFTIQEIKQKIKKG